MNDEALRLHLTRLLEWGDAHATFEKAFADVPEDARDVRPAGTPYSLWELLEHLRLTQRDILDFCRDAGYHEPTWPADYWPTTTMPTDTEAWSDSIASYKRDRAELTRLASDPNVDLFAQIPHGSGQTYLREILLVADHSSHHLGQAILVRRLLRIWG